MMSHDHETRLVHRIESFSDLVMGFSLALLTLTLVVPAHTVQLFTNQWWLIAYFWTFTYISGIWFNHQRLFRHIFYPNNASIFINFVLLSMLSLVVYFVQVFVRMHTDEDRALAFLGYFGAFSISLIASGVLYAIGGVSRWATLALDERRMAMQHAVRGTTVGLALFCGVVWLFATKATFSMSSMFSLAIITVVTVVTVRLIMRVVEPRILGLAPA
jgi:uncharacterized membrane protein